MAEVNYIIVGAEIDEATRHLRPDGTITDTAAPGNVPLNVEFIGALMVKLSQLGEAGVSAEDLARYEAQVKAALQVRPLGGPGGPQMFDAEKQAILDRTTVAIEFESRRKTAGEPDANRRILVVPSDDTLKIREAALMAEGGGPGFDPPLSYELDRRLMLASLEKTILEILDGFAPVPALAPEVKAAFRAHVAAKIKEMITVETDPGSAEDRLLNEILNSPVRAFHRTVGIYATNMCR